YAVKITTMDGISWQKYMLVNQSPKYREDQKYFVRKSLDGTLLYYKEIEEGVLFMGKEDVSGIEPVFTRDEQFVFRYPLTTGTEWQEVTLTRLLIKTGPPQKTVFKIVEEIPVTIKVETTDDTVKVPAGVFHDCVRITMHGYAYKDAGNYVGRTLVDVNETSWYAPGVGLVKMVREESTESQALDKGSMTIELEEFG
ncbi:MAG: hypothetical protein V3R68_05970, partial [Gammaproteobacteria bacterium]